MSMSILNPFVPQHEYRSGQCSFILDSLPAPVFYIDKNECFQYLNKAFESWISSERSMIIGRPMKEVLGEDIFVQVKELTKKALSGVTINFETELSGPGMRTQLVVGSFTPDLDTSGAVKGFIALFNNIKPGDAELTLDQRFTNKTIEVEKVFPVLKGSEDHFKNIADTAPVMIWMAGTDRLCNFFNQSWLDFTGRTLEQELGNGWAENIHPDDFEYCFETYLGAYDKKEEFKMEYRLRRHDGEYRWILDHGIPRFEPDGTFNGFIGACIDITDKEMTAKTLEQEVELRTQEIKIANQQLVSYNEELEQFAYAASHDLQEPLRKIQTFASLLAERNCNELSETGKNFLSKIMRSTERMSEIIKDLLYYSRQTKMDVLFEETDLNIIVENVLSDLELMIQQKGARIEYHDLPRVKVIPSQMDRLFFNLINNSLKFSNPDVAPHISISVKKQPELTEGNHPAFIELMIRDNGIGFEQKYADRIFQLFQRLNDKYSYDGNGIGLALCKKIIQNHYGEIYAEGRPNEGATFHIKLPTHILAMHRALVE